MEDSKRSIHRCLTGIALNNFRGFAEETVIPLGRMTLIFGPNSGGKSTILKALGSFPQSINENRSRVDLSGFEWVPRGSWFDLGDRSSVVHKGYAESGSREFAIGFIIENHIRRITSLRYESDRAIDNGHEIVYTLPKDWEYDKSKLVIEGWSFERDGEHLDLNEFRDLTDGLSEEVPVNAGSKVVSPRYREIMGVIGGPKNKHVELAVSKKLDTVRLTIVGGSKKWHRTFLPVDGRINARNCLGILEESDIVEKLSYHFGFPERDEHGATISAISLEREDHGEFVPLVKMSFSPDIEPARPRDFDYHFSGPEQQVKEKFMEENLCLFDRAELAEKIISAKASRRQEYLDLMERLEGGPGAFDDLDDAGVELAKQLRLLHWAFPGPRKQFTNPRWRRDSLLGRRIINDEGEFEKWSSGLRNAPPRLLMDSLESVVSEELERASDELEELEISANALEDEVEDWENQRQSAVNEPEKTKFRDKANRAKKRAAVENERIRDLQDKFSRPFEEFPRESIELLKNLIGLERNQCTPIVKYWRSDVRGHGPAITARLHYLVSLWFSRPRDEKEVQPEGKCRLIGFHVSGGQHRYLKHFGSQNEKDGLKSISDITRLVSDFSNSIDYLGASRLEPRRYYELSSADAGRLGSGGTKSIANLTAMLMGPGRQQRAHKEKFNHYLERVVGLHAEFNKGSFRGSVVDPNLVTISIGPPGDEGKKLGLPDVGFGVSQCIPLIGATLTSKPLLCEEAESNLHPAAQARLMECLLESLDESKRSQRVSWPLMLLETHSEHFLKSLRNHLREGGGLVDEDVVILYVDVDDETDEAYVVHVETKNGGFLKPWPRDRWDDETDPII